MHVLVDRDVESSLLRRFLDRTVHLGDQLALTAIGGVIGSGKTELLHAACAEMAARGARVITAVAAPADRHTPYAVLQQIVQWLPLGEPWQPGDGEPVLRTALRVMARLELPAPLLIAVDEIEHADPQSLRLLVHLLRSCSGKAVTVLVTHGDQLGEDARAFVEQAGLRRIHLAPLSRQGVRLLLESELDAAEAARLATRFHRETGGSPLLVHALLDDHRTAVLEGTAYTAGEDFQAALLSVLHRSDADCLAVARGVALLGTVADPAVLGRLLDLTEQRIRTALAALQRAGVLDGLRLRHESARDAIIDDIPDSDGRQLLRRAAHQLHTDKAPLLDIARVLSGTPALLPDNESFTTLLLDAAREAVAQGDTDLGLRCVQIAEQRCSDPQGLVALRSAHVRLAWAVRPQACAPLLRELVGSAVDGRMSPVDMASLASGLLWNGWMDDAAAVLRRIEVLSTDSPVEARAEREIMRLIVSCNYPEVAGDQAADPVPGIADPVLAARSIAYSALAGALHPGLPGAPADPVQDLLRQPRAFRRCPDAFLATVLTLVYTDRLSEAGDRCEELQAATSDLRAPAWQAILTATSGLVHLRRGHLTEAIRQAGLALETLPAHAWGVGVGLPLALLLEARTATGDHSAAAEVLDLPVPESMYQTRYGLHYLYARGRHRLATGRYNAALSDFLDCGERMRRWRMDTPALVPWRTGVAEAWLRLGAPERAASLVKEELRLIGPSGALPRVRGRALRVLAATRSPEQRPDLLNQALTLLQEAGDWHAATGTVEELGQAYKELGETVKSRMLVRRAKTMAGGNADDAPPPPRSAGTRRNKKAGVTTLTAAERRVAELAARGYTNQEIAAKLYVTVSTVEQHLTRVYRKTDVKERTNLHVTLRGL